MSDLISRRAAIDAIWHSVGSENGELQSFAEAVIADAEEEIKALPSAQPRCDEWCTDCKEYDQQKHSCPRWNRVIKQTVEDVRKEIPDTTLILAEMLDGSPLLHPCGVLWHAEGWCKEHCKTKRWPQEPDTECWLRYAEVMAAKMEEGE